MWGKPLKFSIMSSDVDQFMYLSVLANHLVLLHVNVHALTATCSDCVYT